MSKTIIFIHGMFQNPKSWKNWQSYFTAEGYTFIAPAWPLHEGNPRQLRNNPPPGLGDLHLQTIVDNMETIVREQPEKPIVIGHSVGGLIVQLLVAKNLVAAVVAIPGLRRSRAGVTLSAGSGDGKRWRNMLHSGFSTLA